MKKRVQILRFLLLLSAIVFSLNAVGQDITVTGKVTNARDGSPMPFVSIAVLNTPVGTLTDNDGNYTIAVRRGSSLVFSFVGFVTQQVLVQDQRVINVVMNPAATILDEIVVIGYGVVRRSDATGSISTVGARDFNQGAITSPQELLVGKSAGVVITNSGGAPGAGAQIRIRGGSSLNASNDPLIVIDGVPIDNSNVGGSANLLSFVNPNDIESFTVLKDASATAIYGSRASNGVIIITTKKGVAGRPMSLTYNVNLSMAEPIEYVDVYSGDQIRQIAFEYRDIFGPESFSRLMQENTNWQQEIFRQAVSQDHNLGVTGSIHNIPYRVSVGYTDQHGILKNTDMQRLTGSINLSPEFFNNSLKVNVNARGMNTHHNFGDPGAVGSAVAMSPAHPIMDGNANSSGFYQWPNYGANLGTPNPVQQALRIDNRSEVNRFMGNIQFDYSMPFLPELRANLNLAGDFSESDGRNNRPVTSPSILTAPLFGRRSDYSATRTNNLLDFYLNYNKELSAINSRIDLTGGYSWQYFKIDGENYTRGWVSREVPYQMTDSSQYINELYLVSFFGRLNYTFMDRYLFTFTVRNDGSSRFAPENRWGLFPSAAFAWQINEESFLRDFRNLSELKLRLGWGVTGQQDVGAYLPYMARYTISSPGSYYLIGGEYIPTMRPEAYDPDIKWEETTTQNIGLDFGFFNGRIAGSFDLYKRVTEDLLNEVTIPSGSNFSNRLLTNVGSLENRGAELTLNLIPISKPDLSLNLGMNLTYNENKVTRLLISDDPNYLGVLYGDAFTGQIQVTRVGYPAYSFFVNRQVYGSNGRPIEGLFVDLSGDGGAVAGDNNDKYIFKNPAPDYSIGFSFRLDYKNFDIAAAARSNIGNYVYNRVNAGASIDQMYAIGFWRNQPTALDNTRFMKRQFTSDYFVENGSFLKIDYLSAGYRFTNLPGGANLRMSLTVQNLLTITNYSGLDPEVLGGIDNNFYPRPRTFLLGLSLGF